MEGGWDFAISNFAFSMFDRPTQDFYIETVFKRARSGYLTMNTGMDGHQKYHPGSWSLEELLQALPNASVQAEEPRTGSGNYIIVYGDYTIPPAARETRKPLFALPRWGR